MLHKRDKMKTSDVILEKIYNSSVLHNSRTKLKWPKDDSMHINF